VTAPELHIMPVGNAGNISAYWKGYREFHSLGKATKLPRHGRISGGGFGADLLWKSDRGTRDRGHRDSYWQSRELGAGQRGDQGFARLDRHRHRRGNPIRAGWLAANEGIFVEPASAASIAGLLKCLSAERCTNCPLPHIPDGSRIVCTVTGHGLKDPDIAREQCGSIIPAKAEKSEILRLLQK
jgi:threonine synthase